MLHHLLQFGQGDPAADFTATDTGGNKIALSTLKGKIIYLDLWATWCGPCMKEMPDFEKLKARYKNNPDVVLVSLSIDDNASLWLKRVSARKAGGYQWNIDRNKLAAYNIVGIPRVLSISMAPKGSKSICRRIWSKSVYSFSPDAVNLSSFTKKRFKF